MNSLEHERPQRVSEQEFDDVTEPIEERRRDGSFDLVADKFGASPWWVISGSFHALLLLLLTLIGMAIMKGKTEDIAVLSVEPPEKPPLVDPIRSTSVIKNPIQTDLPDVQVPVAFVELTEVAEPEIPDETQEDFHDTKGDEGMMDVNTGSVSSVSAAIGLHGGGGRRFGRPNGRGARLWRAKKGGGGKHTEDAVALALKWLADHQEADGHWDCVKYGGKKVAVGVTGLALLAFLGHGETEKAGKYRNTVKKAVRWLKSIQQTDGKYYIQGETHGVGYHHSIAGLAMAEAAGMARVTDTIKSAQRALDYTVDKHQKGSGSDRLAWRYHPKEAKNDLSVSGWFIMQLKSAKVAGLQVDPSSFEGAVKFLNAVEQKGREGEPYGGHRYGYTSSNSVSPRRTAIGCLSRQFLGWKNEELRGGIEWFMQQGGLPQWGANGGSVDLYYWYYATLSTFQYGDDIWKRWNPAMIRALVDNQRLEGDDRGSWDPVGAYAGYWGRVGQTALGALCLEVYYRYPIMLQE